MKLKRVLSLVVAITLIAGCINLGTWHALSYQEAQNPFALMTDGKDSSKPTKYIVKYKSDRRAKFNKKAGEYISKVNSLSLTDAANDYDVLTPEGRMSPSQFTDVLREKDAGKEIEWIIPDYTMTLSEVTAEEDTVATSADDATSKVESNEDNNQEVTQEHSEDGGEEHGSSDEPDVEKQPDTDKESEGDEPDASDEPKIEGQPDADKQPEVKDGQRDIIVAVIDTGVDITHPMISGRLWTNPDETYNGVDDDGNGYIDDVNACNVIDKNGIVFDSERALDSTHGTHVAGLIAKLSAENQVSVKIMPIKAFSDGAGYTSDVLSAIEYATANGADIINLSFGSTEQNPALAEVIAASNALFVCAAGNGRENI
ncbi:MAG: S8 family serine peptidase, partial [Clostridia bacterium]